MKSVLKLSVYALLAAPVAASPAAAQYMPHLDPNLYIFATMGYGSGANPCMIGTPMADAKILEARGLSLATMQRYFRAAQSGSAKSAAFLLDKKAAWTMNGTTLGQAGIDGQSDPLGAPGNRLDAQPLRFYRGGTGATALGQWAVLDGSGQVAGVYTGFFVRSKGEWKIRELLIARADDSLAPAAQYCVKPGDVMEYRVSSTKTWRENAENRVSETRAKLATASERLARNKASLTAAPRNLNLQYAFRDAKSEQQRLAEQLARREESLADAIKEAAKASSDAAELARLTGPARNAQAFRVDPGVKSAEVAARAE